MRKRVIPCISPLSLLMAIIVSFIVSLAGCSSSNTPWVILKNNLLR